MHVGRTLNAPRCIREREERCKRWHNRRGRALGRESLDGDSEFHGQPGGFPSNSSPAVSPLDFGRTCERAYDAWNNIWFISRLVSENRRARSSGRASPSVPEGRVQKNAVFSKSFPSLHAPSQSAPRLASRKADLHTSRGFGRVTSTRWARICQCVLEYSRVYIYTSKSRLSCRECV